MEMPAGVVTLLFSDIAESTRLWERNPDAMAKALERHDRLIADAIASVGGTVFKTKGDGFCATFPTPEAAVLAAATAQRAIDAEPWDPATPMRVRMAIHSGQCHERDGDYFGPPVNRVARLEAVAHGGQVVLSGTTVDLLPTPLPDGLHLRSLGEHQLKDLQAPERVYQLDVDGVDRPRFPPLRSLSNPDLKHNLPLLLTSFVGRTEELHRVSSMFDQTTRLVTLTGTGGCGKTRLALQVGAELLDGDGGGVWFVDLAPLQDERYVAAAVATVLGVSEEPGRDVAESLAAAIGSRAMLVLLDNCEHLLTACATLVDDLLRRCPHLCVLATSREPLGVHGERRFAVPPLELPPPGAAVRAADVVELESVQLLVQRAKLHDPDFEIDDATAPTVAAICRRLDGIPLAIELVAARLAMMGVGEVERRLDDRFRLLKGSSKSAVPRQQTLEASIAWSFDMLSSPEQATLARSSVFVGPFDVAAAETVCAGGAVDALDVMDLVGSLVDRSLLRVEPGPTRRLSIGESIREFAAARLLQLGDDEVLAARARHAAHYVDQAEALDLPPVSTLRAESLAAASATMERLYASAENVPAALRHLSESGGAPDAVLRLAYCVAEQCWRARQFAEGVDTLEAALDRAGTGSLELLARDRLELGMFRIMQGRLAPAQEDLRAARTTAVDARRDDLVVRSDLELAFVGARLGDGSEADAVAHAWSVAEQRGDDDLVGFARYLRGMMGDGSDGAAAIEDLRGAANHFQRRGMERLQWDATASLAVLELEHGDAASAREHFDGVLASDVGQDPAFADPTNLNLAEACLQLGDVDAAVTHWATGALPIAEGKKVAFYVSSLLIAALCCTASGKHREAARLHGAVTALSASLEEQLEPLEAGLRERDLERLGTLLAADALDHEIAAGASLDFEAAMTLARSTLLIA